MPLESKAQGRFLNATKGHDWVKRHHFGGSQKGLPQYVNAQAGLNMVPSPPPGPIPPGALQNAAVPNPGLSLFRKMLAARAIGAKSKATGKPRPKPMPPQMPGSSPF